MEGITRPRLNREQIERIWSEIESGRALPLAEDLRAVFSLALRTMPLPEGEAQALCTEVRKWIEETTRPTLSAVLTRCVETIERQAASLATVERERDEAREKEASMRKGADAVQWRLWAAEASLASARLILQDIADHAEMHSGWWARETARKALSSPRQEGT